MSNVSNNPFLSLVGLRGVDTAAKIWVNDINGINTELVTDLALPSNFLDADNSDPEEPAKAVWAGIHREAYNRLKDEILLQLGEDYDFQPRLAHANEPRRAKPIATVPADPSDNGIYGTIATIPHTPNAEIQLNSLTVYVTPNGSPMNQVQQALVRVCDMDSGAMFYSAPHEFVFGVNTIQLNQQYRTMFLEPLRLGVFVNPVAFLTELELSWSECNAEYSFDGVRAIGLLPDALASKTFVSLDIEVKRSIETLLPRYVNDLANAYRYLCGSMLMTEKLGTPNLSVFTLSNAQFTEKMEASLMKDFSRTIKPIVRLLSNDLLKQQALTPPVAKPSEIKYITGSFV